MLSDKSHLYVQGHYPQYVSFSNDEPIHKEHSLHTVKGPEESCFGCVSALKVQADQCRLIE